ncbi:hypothetical protein [Microbacterium sp. AR7-10]|uniref:hypothetical protein n=1 Tax=Microbacterium sp. AR7-10 TaxID=1891970 RepID=UPI0008FCBC4A|nr:hypothetical protein [Microbacterium sp. AR7-10]OIU88637.1 hypothetical protein BFN01_04130 [Microbacterium sp. AR7-10]
MVRLAATLPKEHDENGLEANTRHLLGIYTSQEYVPIVALVRTKEILSNEDFQRVPKIELVHVEIAVDAESDVAVRELLLQLHDDRVKHVKQPLDLPDVDEEPAIGEPLSLEQLADPYDDVVDAEVVDEDPITDREDD